MGWEFWTKQLDEEDLVESGECEESLGMEFVLADAFSLQPSHCGV